MQPHVLKEIRLLLPATVLTLVIALIPACFTNSANGGWAGSLVCLALGYTIIAACTFGSEFGNGTMAQLLSQPLDRRRIWFQKMLVLASMLAPIALTLLVIYAGRVEESFYWPYWNLVLPVCAFCATPFFTFVTRSNIGAVVLSLAAPILIYLGGGILILCLFKSGALEPTAALSEPINESRLRHWMGAYLGTSLTLYCVGLYLLGYRRFQRLEVTELIERRIGLGTRLHELVEDLLDSFFPSRLRPIAALLGKELRLQQNAITLWLIFTALQVAAVVYIDIVHPDLPENYFNVPLLIYCALMPLIIGGSAIAEERKLGVRAWQLALAPARRTQWFIKASVVLALSVSLAWAVPVAWFLLAHALCPSVSGVEMFGPILDSTLWHSHPRGSMWIDWVATWFGVTQLLTTAISFYTSSFSRDTLRAILATVGICAAFYLTLLPISNLAEALRPITGHVLAPLLRPFYGTTQEIRHGVWEPLFALRARIWIGGTFAVGLCLVIAPLISSFRHFKTIDVGSKEIRWSALTAFLPAFLVLFLFLNVWSFLLHVRYEHRVDLGHSVFGVDDGFPPRGIDVPPR